MAKRLSLLTFFVGVAEVLAIAASPTVSGATVMPGNFVTAKTAY